MRIPRIYHPSALSLFETIMLTEGAGRHVGLVLRLDVGDRIVLFNGDGHDYPAEIVSYHKKKIEVLVKEKQNVQRESPLHIHLGQALSRTDRMDWAIQKAVELGVACITPLITAHCAIHLKKDQLAKKMMHWQAIIIGACEQSGRNVIPALYPVLPLEQWLQEIMHPCGLVCDPLAETRIKDLQPEMKGTSLLIGPEGGLSESELLFSKRQGFIGIRLGQRILRTETAVAAAIGGLQSYWGDS